MDSDDTVPANGDCSEEAEDSEQLTVPETTLGGDNADQDSALDISGKILEFSVLNGADDSIEGLYMYRNAFNLIPRSLGTLGRLKTLKFFANEINLFPSEFRNLVELECLQVKFSSPGLTGLPLHKLKALKELELSKVPPRPSGFPILTEIASLKCLTKLSVCHFSIRYLPPEVGCLKNLEYLDLSFNKMRTLPTEITYLNALISLKIANNKLVDLPSGMSSLQRLENLDLSNNRLTYLGCLELGSMHNLQKLNLQNNKLISFQIPSWICCNLEGNDGDTSHNELICSSVEMDVYESAVQEDGDNLSRNSCNVSSSSHCTVSSSNNRCFAARRSGKGWKRRYYLQQRARQERLNNSRKWKGEDRAKVSAQRAAEKCKSCKHAVRASESIAESSLRIVDPKISDEELLSGEVDCEKLLLPVDNENNSLNEESIVENCLCAALDSGEICGEGETDCTELDLSLDRVSNAAGEQDGSLSSGVNSNPKSKRHLDGDIGNPKPSKSPRPTDDQSDLSCKYSNLSICSTDDQLTDGFYDAGRDRPFMPLERYEQNLHLDSREVILVDREKDEGLDAITLCAQALIFHFKQINGLTNERERAPVDNLQIASLLALFVSDHFGGSDKTAVIQRTRKAVSGSNYRKPFVCTCSTGNNSDARKISLQNLESVEDIVFLDLCEKSLQCIKTRRNSIIVPIGALQFGVCRHRALLMKYLCDRMEPQIPCELVRGYLDFSPHAWNTILIRRNDSLVRMIVDACRPHDIREEKDPEYFCRYIPLSRITVPLVTACDPGSNCSFPSLSQCDEIGKFTSSTLFRCKIGSLEAAAKVRTLEISATSSDEIKTFEYSCLGEVRLLSALKKNHCIVEVFGHQISSKWALPLDGKSEHHRILRSTILMEYIEGGSIKKYIENLLEAGKEHVPMELAVSIARDVACALVELHSKHIIHRDVKSENILIDLNRKRDDGTPVVKLCDFDRAVPLRSFLHTCCIAHAGIPPPDVCVGTPRWMAPEVFRAMHIRNIYGLEVDIWSFGCLLLELLTLKVPYSGLPESEIHEHLQNGTRPKLSEDLEEALLDSVQELPAIEQSGEEQLERPDDDAESSETTTQRFLVNLFHRCTEKNPADRPTAEELYNMLCAHGSSTSSNSEQN